MLVGQLPKYGLRLIKRLPEGSPARLAGWRRFLELLARTDGKTLLRKWARKRLPELHQTPMLWTEMARALVDAEYFDEARNWLSDWKERPEDMTSLAFLCLAAAYDGSSDSSTRSWQAAGEARRIGLDRFPDAPHSAALRAGHALHLAVAGETDQAEAVLANFEPERCNEFYQAMADAARAIVCAAKGDETGARTHLGRSSPHLAQFTDRGSRLIRKRSEGTVAGLLPWARGRIRRLRKQWVLPSEGSRIGTWLSENSGLAWGLAILCFFVIRAGIRLLSE
jgi:hypothetical protein